METMGLDPTAIRRRVEETLDLFGLTPLRGRPLGALSGGQQQRAAIAALFAAGPRVLVLDEPTSALDPVAAEEVLASLHRIVHDLGVTVVLAEHRLERVVHHADRVVLVDDGHTSDLLDPAEAMLHSQIYPPVVGLSRLAGWAPTPLSIRDARRRASALRDRLVERELAIGAGAAGGRPGHGPRASTTCASCGPAASSSTSSTSAWRPARSRLSWAATAPASRPSSARSRHSTLSPRVACASAPPRSTRMP